MAPQSQVFWAESVLFGSLHFSPWDDSPSEANLVQYPLHLLELGSGWCVSSTFSAPLLSVFCFSFSCPFMEFAVYAKRLGYGTDLSMVITVLHWNEKYLKKMAPVPKQKI